MNKEEPGEADGVHFWRIPEWFPDLSTEQVGKLRAYHAELIHFNGRMNLISPRTEQSADLVHFADAILGSRLIFSLTKMTEIFDVGSGNGIPGLVMAVLESGRQMNLIDADARKIEFLKHCINRMGLKNCKAIHARLEDLGEGSIQCATTRAMASVSKSLLMARKAAAIGCEFYHFKSNAWPTEIAEIPAQILASWDPSHINDYTLPVTGITMSIVVTKRVQPKR